jgi:hypothetical protein
MFRCSTDLMKMLDLVRTVEYTESTVLIDGETGRGEKWSEHHFVLQQTPRSSLRKSEPHSDSAEPSTTCMNPVPDIDKIYDRQFPKPRLHTGRNSESTP